MDSHGIIQCTQLGKLGRFGNQLFQYVFARAYAEKYNAVLETPGWVGEKIFKGISHQRPSCALPRTYPDGVPWGQVNVDLFGYFMGEQFFDLLSESKVREWLQFKDEWVEKFRKKENYNIVAHLRRGDYLVRRKRYCLITKKSYIEACKKRGLPADKIIWLSEETQEFTPELGDDLQFLPAFFKMVNADVLLRANSTFSLWAGFFNTNKVYSPLIGNALGFSDVEFVEGNFTKITPRVPDFILG